MIVGHYAAALIPYSRLKEHPFWLLLLCANFPEFLWLALALAGVEAPVPESLMDASFQNLQVQMTYSHNLIPALIQGLVVGAAVYLWRPHRRLALWCGFLVVFHVLCDFVVGFEHQLWDADSMQVAMNTYGSVPRLAIAIELVFSLMCVLWYQHTERKQGRPLPRSQLAALLAVFTIGVALWFPAATRSLREQLQALGF
jgi:hypothetical protein